jgi:hypothetical protein
MSAYVPQNASIAVLAFLATVLLLFVGAWAFLSGWLSAMGFDATPLGMPLPPGEAYVS